MLLTDFINFFRVGAKDGPTRFLTYVDAVLGFKHLLTESDLDKALSMCSSLKGKLRSRFIVLSDDRTPGPPPNRGKRTLDEAEDIDQSSKRNRFVPRSGGQSVPGVAGVSKLGPSEKASVPRKSTPPRAAKKSTLPVQAIEQSQMDEGSSGSNSTEDWASSRSTDEINE